MALCKISIALLGTLTTLVAGDFRYEHFKTFSFNGDVDNGRKPWFADDYGVGYRSEPSQVVPRYVDNLKHGTEPVPSILGAGLKKLPKEDKSFKKAISPFYALSDAEDPKFKELVLKSGAPYCQEITAKGTGLADQGKMTCYRCKDPKNGSSYEHCSYASAQPERNSREPRSNAQVEKTLDSLTSATQPRNAKNPQWEKLPEAFRFSDDYFHTEASHELPTEYERNIDNCERVVKDSMVCMVCKDPKTSGKYEQCSYVAQPNEKAYAYTKSSSFGGAKTKPREHVLKEAVKKAKRIPSDHHESEEEHEAEPDHLHYRHEEPEESPEHHETDYSYEDKDKDKDKDKEGHGSHYVPEHTYHYPSYKDYKGYGSYEEDEEDASPSHNVKSKANCKTVDKDGQSCTVCVDPKTGGKSESCNYSHEPKDKFYKYSKSKSFGYPESDKKSDDKTPEPSEKQERESGSDEDYGDYIRSESEKISKQVKGQGDCRKVKKDSMICTVCKDPKTGGDFEQCNYSYEPEDKVFAYSKSKSFGNPTRSSEYDYGSEEHPEETYTSPAVIYPTGTSVLDYIPKTSESQLSSIVYTTKKPHSPQGASDSRVDTGFYDATVRRAEIEKIVKDIGSEDRSKCTKMFRGGMTCYRCTDEKGITNEECVFVTEPVGQSSEPKPTVTTTTSTSTSTTSTTTAASTTASVRQTRETKEKKPVKDQDEELKVLDEELDEAEPYDYVAETRPVYDKVLGLTLPAYMIQKSQHEIEFDEIVENAKF